MHRENLRKFTKTRAAAPRACYAEISSYPRRQYMYKERLALYCTKESKISKVDYSSKAKVFNVHANVRGVGAFFVTCSNLGQLSPYNCKNLCGHFPRAFNQKNYALSILYRTFWDYFWNLREISVLVGLLESENNDFMWKIAFLSPISTVYGEEIWGTAYSRTHVVCKVCKTTVQLVQVMARIHSTTICSHTAPNVPTKFSTGGIR
jgi:hypothetical protein